MKTMILILFFLAVSALLIISNNDLSLYKQENVEEFSALYVQWLNEIYSNMQTLTGNAVKLDWLPG